MPKPPPPPGPPMQRKQLSKPSRPPPPPPKGAPVGKRPSAQPGPPTPSRAPAPPRLSMSGTKRPVDVGSVNGGHGAKGARTSHAHARLSGHSGIKSFRKGGKFGTEITIRRPVELRHVTDYEKRQQVGKGTYGDVFMGADKVTGKIVALKRINTAKEENGFPITSIREVKILKALHHVNIVKLLEIVTSEETERKEKSVYLVFEYHEYDLTGILETREITLNHDHIKSWSRQLLAGVHYMHVNGIMHRDLKASNILISRTGELKICDWGLARSWNSDMKQLTNGVVTLWYRPIELLLGCKKYDTKIDMWSVGCIIAEMFRRRGLLRGCDEASQLKIIFETCGHPSVIDWPQITSLPLWGSYGPNDDEPRRPSRLREALKYPPLPNPSWLTEKAIDLIRNLLAYNPEKRWSAKQAFVADYFTESPVAKEASKLSMRLGVAAVHEWETRRRAATAANGVLPMHKRRK
eukprot:CAMPEP_0197243948 /NCGR_PEP_ID=MMETSP1429-20130617/9229_1 /TAXON_ID=49237 /ORGANISM="Chaetoceros  sp., Strain UNC1202" /LENGTH=464 /DNA_ID=CAMNT_0042704241 /DNA_START=441 /DNA_END=1835 /DNA_ORIENTATION=+